MTKVQKLLVLYGVYKKAVHAEIVVVLGWATEVLALSHGPVTRNDWLALAVLIFAGPTVATTTNIPMDPVLPSTYVETVAAPMEPAFPPPVPGLPGE